MFDNEIRAVTQGAQGRTFAIFANCIDMNKEAKKQRKKANTQNKQNKRMNERTNKRTNK